MCVCVRVQNHTGTISTSMQYTNTQTQRLLQLTQKTISPLYTMFSFKSWPNPCPRPKIMKERERKLKHRKNNWCIYSLVASNNGNCFVIVKCYCIVRRLYTEYIVLYSLGYTAASTDRTLFFLFFPVFTCAIHSSQLYIYQSSNQCVCMCAHDVA